MMKHYLLSEQDLDEILWEVEYNMWLLSEKIRDKYVNEEFQELKERDKNIESLEF